MKSFTVLSALLGLTAAAVLPRDEPVSYDGYKVFRVATGASLETVKAALAPFSENQWNRDISQHIDVAISPDQLQTFEALGLVADVMHEDLGAAIASEGDSDTFSTNAAVAAAPDATWFNSYHSYADHQQYFKDLQALLPSNSELINSGTSYQGRPIFGIHLWGSGGKGSKPAVLFHSSVHAREWITTMVVEYITYNLVTGYNKDASVTGFLNKYDFYIIPFANPDGFVYSQTTDRLWRKNRQPAPSGSGSSCVGRDVNRNWPYQWDSNPNGASTNPCDQTYRGAAPGDSPENKGLVSLVQSLRSGAGIKLYIDWHSYGQYLLSPYGYDCNKVAANNAKHQSLASGTVNSFASRYGTKFTYGPSCSTLYATTGSSTDYVLDVGQAELTYTVELRDKGTNGFVIPANQIRPSGEEAWDGIKYLLNSM